MKTGNPNTTKTLQLWLDRCAGHITEEEFEELLFKRIEELRRLTNGDGRHTLNRKKSVKRQ